MFIKTVFIEALFFSIFVSYHCGICGSEEDELCWFFMVYLHIYKGSVCLSDVCAALTAL